MTRGIPATAPRRVLLLGATGTIGRATAAALLAAGHAVTCIVRPDNGRALPPGAIRREARVDDPAVLSRDGFADDRFDVLVSCLASRSGTPADAWRIDHDAHLAALDLAVATGVDHFVLLSAICVQKPRLAFQHAKLAFEARLMTSGIRYCIVRPTAYFKSLSGQIARVQAGKPYLMFGDGTGTACKPIGDADLGAYIAGCIDAPDRADAILPIGGPGPALTPADMGAMLFRLTGQTPRTTRVPLWFLGGIVRVLSLAGRVSVRARAKAELARIGQYYASELMLVWDADAGCYDADATPETGTDTLEAFYARVISGEETVDRGDHAVF